MWDKGKFHGQAFAEYDREYWRALDDCTVGMIEGQELIVIEGTGEISQTDPACLLSFEVHVQVLYSLNVPVFL